MILKRKTPRHGATMLATGLLVLIFGSGASGEATYEAVCASCHGHDGRGGPGRASLQLELPDFTDCSFNSREPDADFFAVAHQGGPVRGFSPLMPAHGGVLSDAEILAALDRIRSFCTEDGWPRGDLNLPRPLFTEKAFPEDEAVITTSVALDESDAASVVLLYEKRLGRRSQLEVKVPLALETVARSQSAGFGDIELGIKHVVWDSLKKGGIASVGFDVRLPTGDEDRGLGKGTVLAEPYVSWSQMLPGDAFSHLQLKAEIPNDRDDANPEVLLRWAVGRTFTKGRFGRSWSPMLETLVTREFPRGGRDWQVDLVPQVQVSLNERQHLLLNVGLRVPITQSEDRSTELLVYLLWDWFDGGLADGW